MKNTILVCSSTLDDVSGFDQSWQAIEDFSNATISSNSLTAPVASANIAKVDTFENILNNERYSECRCKTKNITKFRQIVIQNFESLHSCSAAMIPISKKMSTISKSNTTASNQEKMNATQLKFQNFDSEITQLISGLKSNLKKEPEEVSNLDDDNMLLDNDMEPLELTPITRKSCDELVLNTPNDQQVSSTDESAIQVNLNKPLADIVIDLNDIRPHDNYAPRCIMDEKSGLKIILNFTKDKPRADVAVLVITTMNQNSLPIKNFQFEASVAKVKHMPLSIAPYFYECILHNIVFDRSFSPVNCI